jgi:three-Cys-motif partner protein
MLEALPQLSDDGLIIPEVGSWAERKYRVIWNYAKVFSTGMKNKWDKLVYVDLFSGAGYTNISGTSMIIPSSPLLALTVKDQFSKYIFCEQDAVKLKALRERVSRDFVGVDVSYFEGDSIGNIDKVIAEIPTHGPSQKVLTFCFIDPYKIRNFQFRVITMLSNRFVDFLILIPSFMDANRNIQRYAQDTHISIEDFTGMSNWREEWNREKLKGRSFGSFLPDIFGQSMINLGYKYEGSESTIKIRYPNNNTPLYHLCFFSKHEQGMKFWRQAKKYSTDQGELF